MNYRHFISICAKPLVKIDDISVPKTFALHILFFTNISRMRYTRDSFPRMNCNGRISYLTFRFGIIHCHYCFFFSYYCLQSILFIALCKIEMMKARANPHETVRESERVRYTRIVTNFHPARCKNSRRFSRFCISCIVSNIFYLYVTLMINERKSS